jgi:YggT family protein
MENAVFLVFLQILAAVLKLIQILVFASVIISWVGDPHNPIVRMIHDITEPIYRPFRVITRKIPGPLDWTPVLLLIVISAILNVIPV